MSNVIEILEKYLYICITKVNNKLVKVKMSRKLYANRKKINLRPKFLDGKRTKIFIFVLIFISINSFNFFLLLL